MSENPEDSPGPVPLPIGEPYRGAKIFIGQVPRDMTEDLLRPHFAEYGQITDIKVIRDRATGEHKGL